MSTPIRASSILPGHREDIELHTADGLRLVGELARPADRDPVATLVCLHPLPTHGGMMDSHVFRKAAWRLPALADLAVLRFNTRGTSSVRGTSEGPSTTRWASASTSPPRSSTPSSHELPNIWLVGWSFGTDLTLKYGCDPAVAGAILLSPPLRFSNPEDLAVWAESGKPLTALVPEFDDYLRPDEARERFAAVPQAEVVGVPGAKHLWVGDAERVLDEIVRRVNPAVAAAAADQLGRPDGDRRRQRVRRPYGGRLRRHPRAGSRRRLSPPPSRRGLSGDPGGGAPPRAGSAGARRPPGSRSARPPRPSAPPRAGRPAVRPPR